MASVAIVLVLAAPAAHAATGGFRAMADDAKPVIAAHGDDVVWTREAGGRSDLLRSGPGEGPHVLTSIVLPNRVPRVGALAYDGRHVAWTDDRFGVAEAFLLDTQVGTQTRLSATPVPESSVALGSGLAAWSSGRTVHVLHLASGDRWNTTGPHEADDLAIWAGGLAWAEVSEGTRALVVAGHDGQGRHVLDGGEASRIVAGVASHGGGIAWDVVVLEEAPGGVRQLHQVRAWNGSAVTNLTLPLPFQEGPWGGGGRLAWSQALHDGAVLTVWDAGTRRTEGGLDLPGRAVAVTATHLFSVSPDGVLFVAGAGPPPGPSVLPSPSVVHLLAGLALVGWLRRG